ncbi:MAG TPA: ABC transporter ATP-binding protein, partial [Fibrobacteraceae bacterium]|nr:ABC transporter ATP-binding protein [Fibrobacteraceae bacterium]
MATAIEFENISKQYRLGLVSTGTLSHDLNRFWHTKVLRREDPYLKIGETNDRSHRGKSEYVWALKNIDFKVEQGDVVGIIGKNGAGKSTLLKLLSRVTAPTTGIIRAKGRIASLLEVGTGFHPEMTGRENIYMNGAIMGMTRSEITRKLDEIVDFSGCERYLDTPVKRYSSGMIVRLGFAIAAHLEPEILVVDEVLAVGDAEFQKKAIGKMQDVSQGEGRTVLFVSHNMGAVKNLCKRGVLLEQGKVKRIGPVNDVVDEYINQNQGIFEFTKYKDRSGNGTIKINSVEYFNSNNEKIN